MKNGESFRLVSWNISGARLNASGDQFAYGAENIPYFAESIAKLEPDIVCIQESHMRDDGSLAQELASRLRMPYVHEAPESPSHIDQKSTLCNAVITNEPSTQHVIKTVPYPHFPLRWESGIEAAHYDKVIQIMGIRGICIANLHFHPIDLWGYSYEHGVGTELALETDKMLQEIAAPLILAGDFNTNTPLQTYTQSARKHSLSNAISSGITRPRKPSAFPHPDKPDHIIYSKGIIKVHSGVIPKDTDHYLLYADFNIEPS